MWTQRGERRRRRRRTPSRRRDQTRRNPTTRVVPAAPRRRGIGAEHLDLRRPDQPGQAACSPYHPRSKPSAAEWSQARSWA